MLIKKFKTHKLLQNTVLPNHNTKDLTITLGVQINKQTLIKFCINKAQDTFMQIDYQHFTTQIAIKL